MATATKSIVINEPLCFISRKFGRYGSKQLKSLLYDFYSGDVLANAKEMLASAVADLKIDGCPVGRKRRESKDNPDAKIRADIDDMMAVIVFLDENKHMDLLPVFVAADPDLIPSLRIQEGDMLVVLNKLAVIEDRCASMHREMEEMRAAIARTPSSERLAVSGATKQSEQPIGASDRNPPVCLLGRYDRVLESEISSAVDSEGEMETNGGEGFILAETRSGKRIRMKRHRPSDSPTSQTYASVSKQNQLNAAASTMKQPPAAPNKTRPAALKKPVMIGHSTTSSMRAAKSLNLPKAVFRIGNIDACYTAADVQQYVETLGVRVVSCFERTSEKSRFTDNKTFRICIFDADKAELLSDSNWSVGISIQRWVFKPKVGGQEGVGGTGGIVAGGVSTGERMVGEEVGSGVGGVIDPKNGVSSH